MKLRFYSILSAIELILAVICLVNRDIEGSRHCTEMVFLVLILGKLETSHEL